MSDVGARLQVVPLTLAQANELVSRFHRHHKPVVSHRFSIGVRTSKGLVGAVIVGRPVARMTETYTVAEVTRLVTDGTRNACSILYAAAARAADAMGFECIQTFILASEPGTSLKAAGWIREADSAGGDWNRPSRGSRRTDQPQAPKVRWAKVFRVANGDKETGLMRDRDALRLVAERKSTSGYLDLG